MKARKVATLGMIIAFALVASWSKCMAQQTRSEPSTPEERKRALDVTRKLEKNPLGPEAMEDRRWITEWIIEIPDITVPICDEVLKSVIVTDDNRYRYARELFAQATAGSMAYLIEHPAVAKEVKEGNNDNDFAIYKAGLDSALNAYESIVKNGAKAGKWAPLDDLLKKRQSGKWDDYVRGITLKCIVEAEDTERASLR